MVRRKLGAGAMADVYLGYDDRLQREVAIKALRDEGVPDYGLETFHARFTNEARAVAALGHPNVVQIFDMGVEENIPYLVMELATGSSLAARVEEQGLLTPEQAVALLLQIAGALDAAHRAGIVHRDVKPGNILETEPGVWKLGDFGIARLPDSRLTMTGQFLGSPAYAPAEAIQRGEVSPATDVYGLGAAIYTALTGQPPFGPRGFLSPGVLTETTEAVPIADRREGLPAGLSAAVDAAIRRDSQKRPSARQLIELCGVTDEAVGPARLVPDPSEVGRPATPVAPTWTPVAHARSPRWRRNLGIAGALFAVLILGIIMGSSESPDGTVPAPAASIPHSESERDARWQSIQSVVSGGDTRQAKKMLRDYLRDFPGDETALELYDQLRMRRDRSRQP